MSLRDCLLLVALAMCLIGTLASAMLFLCGRRGAGCAALAGVVAKLAGIFIFLP
jgi:hypothetical protein